MRHLFTLLLAFGVLMTACTNDQPKEPVDETQKTTPTTAPQESPGERTAPLASDPSKQVTSSGFTRQEPDQAAVAKRDEMMAQGKIQKQSAPKWAKDLVAGDPGKTKIIMCQQYDGGYVFFVNDCVGCPGTQLTKVYDRNQKYLCQIGGEEQQNTCDDFKFDGQKDCELVEI